MKCLMAERPDLTNLSRGELIRLVVQLWEQGNELRKQNEELRRNQKRSAAPFSQGTSKKNPKRRKPGQGPFRRREEPKASPDSPPIDVFVEHRVCPVCGGRLEPEQAETVSHTDIPPQPEPETKLYRVHRCRCQNCKRQYRGQHPDVAADQQGATAHRVGWRVKAVAHAIHYGHGVTSRKTVEILRDVTGLRLTQSALVQDGLKRAGGEVGKVYQELRGRVKEAPVTYTDDTGWRVGGKTAFLMTFDTDQENLGDRSGSRYEAEALKKVEQSKCSSHLIGNVDEVLETKRGAARQFRLRLKAILKKGNRVWRDHRAGRIADLSKPAGKIQRELKHHLRHRRLRDPDNQRLLDGIGLQNDQGRVLRYLEKPEVEPTNNRAERALRPAVIARKVSHCSKNERGAEAYSAFHSVLQTAKKGGASFTQTLCALFGAR